VNPRHYLSALFEPAGALLIVAHADPALDLPWVADVRAAFGAEREDGPVKRRVAVLGAPAPGDRGPGPECSPGPGSSPGRGNCPSPMMPAAIDLAVVATPIESAWAALELAAAHGARAAVLLDSCSDPQRVRELAERARALRICLLGPGSMGLMRPALQLDASRMGQLPAAGNVALVSQSGVLGAAILDWAGDTAIGFSLIASPGMESDVDLAQILDFLASDSRTRAVVVYLEAVREARGFMSALRALAAVKPVVVLKGGRDAATGPAARTHSGALADGDAVYSAALRRAGAVQVRLFTQLFTAVRYLAARNWPLGKRLAIVANGRGPALLAADQALVQGIGVLPFAPATALALGSRSPAIQAVNPLNLGLDAGPDDYANAIEAIAADPDSDAMLALMAPGAGVDAAAITERVAAISKTFAKPLFACWLGDSSVRGLRTTLDAAGLPVFRTPEAAVDAFSTVATFYQNQLLLQQTPRPLSDMDRPDVDGARAIIGKVIAEGREVLTEVESKALLGAFLIPVTRTVLARSASEAVALAEQIGFPVVMKVASLAVTHKSDVGGVSLNVRNAAEVCTQFEAIVSSVRASLAHAEIQGVTLQPMLRNRHARELYVGVFRSRLFGPIVAFGAGGTGVELVRDTTLEFPPLNAFLAASMIGRTRIARALREFRGAPAADEECIAQVLVRVSEMICELPQLAEMDINPLIADDRGAVAVDARVVLDRTPPRAGPRYGHMAIMPYPAYLSHEAVLRDGRPYLVRPIQAEDADALQRFTRALSPESRYFRFISALNELTPRMLVRYTQIDYDRELALVAVLRPHPDAPGPGAADRQQREGELIGVARYLLNPDRDSCEYAIAIGDRFQRQGLGSTLMRALIAEARVRGLKRMEGYVLSMNAPMLRLMRSLGFEIGRDPDDESMKRVWLSLEDEPDEGGAPGPAPQRRESGGQAK
jgi:acetyltransferase